MSRQTWGDYLDLHRKDIQELLEAFKERGCVITFFEAAHFVELAMLRSTIVIDSEAAEAEDRDEGEAWKHGSG